MRKKSIFLLIGMVIVLAWSLIPIYWSVQFSFKTDAALFSDPTLIPDVSNLTLKSYVQVFDQYPFARYFFNSIVISLGAVILSLVTTVPGAYAFTRLKFPGKKYLFYGSIITIFFPWIVLIIPVYDIYKQLGMLNTYYGVIIIYTAIIIPLCLWLLNGFFQSSIDKDLEDAARVDGTTKLGAFFRVILPLSMPAISAVAIFTFLVAWNEFIWVFLLTSGDAKRTAVVGLHYMMGTDIARDWNALLAALFMTSLPPMIFYAFLQRYLTDAFTTTGGTKR